MGVFTDYVLAITPVYLQKKWGRRWAKQIGQTFDGMHLGTLDAVRARLLKYAPPDSIDAHAFMRKIERAPGEAVSMFRERLKRTFHFHEIGGTRKGILEQLNIGGFTNAFVLQNDDWSFDSDTSSWWRFWVLIARPHRFTAGDGVWGDPGTWSDGGLWAITGPVEDIALIRRIIATWKGAHTICHSILVVISGELWGAPPEGTWGDPGTWGCVMTSFSPT